MISTIGLTKTPTSHRGVLPGDIIDGCRVTAAHTKDFWIDGSPLSFTRLQFAGEGWGTWTLSHWPVSVWR